MDEHETMTVDDVMAWLSDVIRGTEEHDGASYRDRLTAAKLLVEIYDTEYERDGDGFSDVIIYGEEKLLAGGSCDEPAETDLTV